VRIDVDPGFVEALLTPSALDGVDLDLVPVPTRDVYRTVNVFEINATFSGQRVDLVEFLGDFALSIGRVSYGCEYQQDRHSAHYRPSQSASLD
jgi:hypothetical protein